MKKVLIVGSQSYIGSSFERYAHGRLDVSTIGSLNDEWRNYDFSVFDSVVYVAGIAHRKQTRNNKDLYFKVNRDLAVSVAQKAKTDGTRQFVYFSSMAVYGMKSGEINECTVPAPRTDDHYGLSKHQAEELLEPMQSDAFHVAIIRPPTVYGYGCKGNFPLLVRIVKAAPFLPTLRNKRSMIYIDNLSEFLALIIEREAQGVYCPQNKEYVCTAIMMGEIAISFGKTYRRLPLLNPFLHILMPVSPPLKSAFGNLYYSLKKSTLPFEQDYQIVGFLESIKRSLEVNGL